jgi:hypothetical protein
VSIGGKDFTGGASQRQKTEHWQAELVAGKYWADMPGDVYGFLKTLLNLVALRST